MTTMSLQALLKRRPREVDLDGEKVHVRSLTMREAMEFDAITEAGDSVKAARFAISRCVVDAAGELLCEPDADQVNDIPLDTMYRLSEAIKDVSRAATPKAIAKN